MLYYCKYHHSNKKNKSTCNLQVLNVKGLYLPGIDEDKLVNELNEGKQILILASLIMLECCCS